MKKILFSIVTFIVFTLTSFGQAPEGFKYQAVVRDAQNIILNNQIVGMQLAILQGSPNGSAVYTETFTPTTNAYGLVNLEIGTGISSDDFTIIDWANGPYFFEIAIDITGGTSYSVMGTSQLLSVPYAMHSKNAENVINDLVEDDDADPTNELNTGVLLNGTNLEVTDDGGTIITDLSFLQDGVTDADADPTNEIQTLSQSGNSISLSNGGGSVELSGTVAFVESKAGSGATPTSIRSFLSTKLSVAITSSAQKVHITVSQSFGSTTGASGLDIYPGYRIDGSNATPTVISLGIFNLTVAAGHRNTFSITGVVTNLNPGIYDFGMVGDDDGNGNWNNNEWGYISVLVIN